MPPTADIDALRQKLIHADAVIAELRGVVAELRKQIDAQQAHIHRLVRSPLAAAANGLKAPRSSTASTPPKPIRRPRSLSKRCPKQRLPRRSGGGTVGGRS